MADIPLQIKKLQKEFELESDYKEKRSIAAAILGLKMRSGSLNPEKVKFCASLGDPSCLELFPTEPHIYLESHSYDVIETLNNDYNFIDDQFWLDFSIWMARRALSIWHEIELPQYSRVFREIINIGQRKLRGEGVSKTILEDYFFEIEEASNAALEVEGGFMPSDAALVIGSLYDVLYDPERYLYPRPILVTLNELSDLLDKSQNDLMIEFILLDSGD